MTEFGFACQAFQITRMGFFDCGYSLNLSGSESNRNQKLNELCVAMQAKTEWQWEIANVATLSGGENVSEELRRYGMPIRAQIPSTYHRPEDWLPSQVSGVCVEEDAVVYLYENGIGFLNVTAKFGTQQPVALDTINVFMELFMRWRSPAYYPAPVWRVISGFQGIVSSAEWSRIQVAELRRSEHFITATQDTPIYLVYLICMLNIPSEMSRKNPLLVSLSEWISDSFASDQPVPFNKLANGLYAAISWDVTVVVTHEQEGQRLGWDVVQLLGIIHYFWFLVYMTDSLLNRKIRELEIARATSQVEAGIRQLRAFRVHIWRTIDNFRLVKLSMLPLHMVVFETTRKEWKIDQIEASIVEKLDFLDTVYNQLRDELQERQQSSLNLIALLFTVITFASAVATVIATYDFDNTQFTRVVRAIMLLSSPFFAALVTWLIIAIFGRSKRKAR